ncbi:hypothetical protein EYF80_012902 [Liparis tanakae]|uniref:Uncharacterized protein n=1 Tax=Liparis tanakae TaxID=230148 RepID=A0A4Z2IFM2_9TELE|nr:hypothetical protein EYF80_012902 [Liparis tanakae]
MFENSVAQQQSPQTSRPGQHSTRRSPASANHNLGSSSVDSSSFGGQQRLKNAINLGKAVGAKVNDLLRRKEPSHLGDIGVTEVNKNVDAVWSCMDQLTQTTANSNFSSFDSFPRLDPPPPSGKKRLPRALKTTQDMMISSDPVVSSPDAADSSSFLPAADKTPLIGPQEPGSGEERRRGEKEDGAEKRETTGSNGNGVEVTRGGGDVVANGSAGGGEEERRPLLPAPDPVDGERPPEPRAAPDDIWQKAAGPDSRLASTPRSAKASCRISLGEELLLGNGGPGHKGGADDPEPHPDLLVFE